MPFYVPLGPRGLIFRLGSLLTGVIGGYTYWRASRRRKRGREVIPIPVNTEDAPRER